VTEYDTKFTQLSRYAEGLVRDEEEKTKRFVRDLKPKIRGKLIALRLQAYIVAVEIALKVEMDMRGKQENRIDEENTS